MQRKKVGPSKVILIGPGGCCLSLTLITLSQFEITEMARTFLVTVLIISGDLFQNRDTKFSGQEASTL